MSNLIIHISCLLLLIGTSLSAQDKRVIIDGTIQISDSPNPNAADGTIRWTGSDFEGRVGSTWVSLTSGGGASNAAPNTVTDIEGNVYKTVTIGLQTWMRENLRTSLYNDGSIITEASMDIDWASNNPLWCWYENNHMNDEEKGKLYNWYAVDAASNGGKNVCPSGWHVPNEADWNQLIDYLEGSSTNGNVLGIQSLQVGGKMKMVGSSAWQSPNTGASNQSGFTGVPSGFRNNFGGFGSLDQVSYWWSQTSNTASNAWYRKVNYDNAYIERGSIIKSFGFPVRCVQD